MVADCYHSDYNKNGQYINVKKILQKINIDIQKKKKNTT
jgi:hypothetical protein